MAPRARTTDPSTSHDAAASVAQPTEVMRRILSVFHDAGRGFTDEALCGRVHHRFGRKRMSDASIRSRRKELEMVGFVHAVGKDRIESGREARVFKITEAGAAYIEAHPVS